MGPSPLTRVPLCSDTLKGAALADSGPALLGRENIGPSDLLFLFCTSLGFGLTIIVCLAGEELLPGGVVRISELIHVKTLEQGLAQHSISPNCSFIYLTNIY